MQMSESKDSILERRKKLRSALSGDVAFCQTGTDLRYDTAVGYPVHLNNKTISALVDILLPEGTNE